MHRDYSITGTQASVEVYDDRVEVVNPGRLPKGLSVQNLGAVSIRRNELLADLFFRLHKVERVGMGIRKMKEGMTAAGLREPTFAPDAFFRAIFHRSPDLALKKGVSASRTASEKMSEKMSEKTSGGTSGRILSALTEHPEATIADLAEAIGVTGRTIERHLKRLQEQGLLRRVGPDKGGLWEVLT
jgi:ATP-dependent DNA helicase RecG